MEAVCARAPFANTESLRKLLQYLVEHTLTQPGAPLREAHIAAEVFGKTAGFDPKVDSTVRVQMSRLRTRLAEYYEREGAADRYLIEIPKGTYAVTLTERPAVAPPVSDPIAPPAIAIPPPAVRPNWQWAAAGFLAGSLFTFLVLRSLA